MTKRYYILSLLLLWTSLLFAQDKLKVSVSKTTVAVGEPFEITYSIDANGSNFRPPDFKNFQVVSGPNVSTSMTVINGAMTSSTTYSYDLAAVSGGTYAINEGAIMVNGKRVVSTSVVINVTKGKYTAPNNQQQAAQNGPDDNITAGNETDLAKLVFIKVNVDKTQVYQGEQLNVTYKLYTKVGISGSQIDKSPDFNGFWSQDITNPQNVQWVIENYKGQRFNVATLKQTILYPQHAGNLVVDPFAMTLVVRQPVQSNDPMDQFFGGSYKEVKYKVKSTAVTIHAKPLPDAGKPVGYEDAVGNFTAEASLDKTELKANEPINYRIKITGRGGIKLLNPPKINFPSDFEKYDPKVVDSVTEDVNGVAGYRIYNFLLIPRREGDYTIPPYNFSYFNPASQRYITITTRPFHIKVNKGVPGTNVTAYSPDKQDVKVLGNDIRYIKTSSPDLNKADDEFYGSALFYILLLLGPVAFAAALGYRRWDAKNNSDQVLVKSRKANKMAAKHMANAQKQLAAGDTKAFYEDVAKGLFGYLSDKLNIPMAILNKENIASSLKTRGLNAQIIGQLIDTLDLCEMARYSPVSGISKEEVFEKSKSMINDIENKI